jgi:cytochrome c oxidase assembly protein subunit 15
MTQPEVAVAHRLGLATLATTGVLIVLGGLVTNTGGGLAVPDWPSTFGHNMFLFPWSQMIGGVFYEHSHRLVGALVGLLTLVLAAALWRAGGRLRALGLVAVAVVLAQGVLGGLRVVLRQEALAIFHGSLAQAFFALLAAVAMLTTPRGPVAVAPVARALKVLTVAAAALVYAQTVLGALVTHDGRLGLHLAGALVVLALVPLAAAQARRTGDVVAAPLASLLLVLLRLQLALGAGSFLARFSSLWIPGGQTTMLLLPVAHRLVGSLVLGIVVALAVRLAGAHLLPDSEKP